jgi:hypothetical protein
MNNNFDSSQELPRKRPNSKESKASIGRPCCDDRVPNALIEYENIKKTRSAEKVEKQSSPLKKNMSEP